MSVDSLEKLNVWRKAKEFTLLIYQEILPLLPTTEKWAMDQQIRRSAISIPANIAEGYGRYYFQETIRFCYIARGSLEETLNFLILAHELKYIPIEKYRNISVAGDELGRLINGYITYLKKARTGFNEPGYLSIHESPSDFLLDPEPEAVPDE
jgi:four helix bundle protein